MAAPLTRMQSFDLEGCQAPPVFDSPGGQPSQPSDPQADEAPQPTRAGKARAGAADALKIAFAVDNISPLKHLHWRNGCSAVLTGDTGAFLSRVSTNTWPAVVSIPAQCQPRMAAWAPCGGDCPGDGVRSSSQSATDPMHAMSPARTPVRICRLLPRLSSTRAMRDTPGEGGVGAAHDGAC